MYNPLFLSNLSEMEGSGYSPVDDETDERSDDNDDVYIEETGSTPDYQNDIASDYQNDIASDIVVSKIVASDSEASGFGNVNNLTYTHQDGVYWDYDNCCEDMYLDDDW